MVRIGTTAATLLAFMGCGRIGFDSSDPGRDGSVPIDLLPSCAIAPLPAAAFVVDPAGTDAAAGTPQAPWKTLGHAYATVPDGATIIVRPGTYDEEVAATRTLTVGITLRAEPRYTAHWISTTGSPLFCTGCAGLTVEGFDIDGSASPSNAPLVHLTNGASRVAVRDSIVHDGRNATIRINDGAHDIVVARNAVYGPASQAIHVAEAANIIVEDNIVFDVKVASSPLIWLENQDAVRDPGHVVRRNVLLAWRHLALDDSPVALTGTLGAVVENNVVIGDPVSPVAGVVFLDGTAGTRLRGNTVTGAFSGAPFGIRLEASTGLNVDLLIASNAFADPSGTMGQFAQGGPDAVDASALDVRTNAYWNGGQPIDDGPPTVVLRSTTGRGATFGDPRLGTTAPVPLPIWNPTSHEFDGGSRTICEAFIAVVNAAAIPGAGSALIGAGETSGVADDIFARPRPSSPTIGALEP